MFGRRLAQGIILRFDGSAPIEDTKPIIALIDENMPVVVLLPKDRLYEKSVNNLMEVRARNAPVIAFVSEGDRELDQVADKVFAVPDVHPLLTPVLFTVGLQLLAYHIAVLRGLDVDRPRNLAKSVTVE